MDFQLNSEPKSVVVFSKSNVRSDLDGAELRVLLPGYKADCPGEASCVAAGKKLLGIGSDCLPWSTHFARNTQFGFQDSIRGLHVTVSSPGRCCDRRILWVVWHNIFQVLFRSLTKSHLYYLWAKWDSIQVRFDAEHVYRVFAAS